MTLLNEPINLDRPEGPLAPVRRLTIDEYVGMYESGILTDDDRCELLDGIIYRKDRSKAGEDIMTMGTEHFWGVTRCGGLNGRLGKRGCHIRLQGPVELPFYSMPEPDVVIAIGTNDDYLEHHPRPEDILCIIEVSDSSLRTDRTRKLKIYATQGIKLYLILNLPDRVIEVYTDPLPEEGLYRTVQTLHAGTLHLPTATGKPLAVAVKSLLPPGKRS